VIKVLALDFLEISFILADKTQRNPKYP